MTPDQYRRLGEIFDQVHELPERDRTAVLTAACGRDPELRAEIVALLDGDTQAANGAFLERPALAEAARLLSQEAFDTPEPGDMVGHCRLGTRIGAGGMGVVFQAEDLKLQRRIALKILPRNLAAGMPERVQRFEREARAAGKLTHPNIASVYDIDCHDGYYYIAMELVQGKTLRDLLRESNRGLDSKTVFDVIAQTASALAAAHESGVIHRDIKPENIIVRPDGLVKVLDFGLARMREPGSSDSIADLQTRAGRLAGTIQYLSPEQVLGKPAGPRSDVFSLGVVAYELATGVRPFEGPTDGAIFNAILHQEPVAPSSIRPEIRGDFERLILEALEKDPELRLQTAGEFRSACKRLLRDGRPAAPERPRIGPKRALPIALSAVIASAAALALVWFFGRPPAGDFEPSQFQQLTEGAGQETFPSLTADGRQFVFDATQAGRPDIYFQRAGGSRALNLTKDFAGGGTQPALSPDGLRIAFRTERDGGGLFVMGATGENYRRITSRGYFPAWSPDNRHIAYCTHTFQTANQVPSPPSNLFVLDLDSGSETQLKVGDALQPNWSPHNRRIAFWGISAGGRRDIFTIDAAGHGAPVPVTSDPALDWNPVWSASGRYLWFLSDRGGTKNLWRVRIDENTGRTLAPPQPVVVPASSVENFTLSSDGESLAYSEASLRSTLNRIAFDAKRQSTAGDPEPVGDVEPISDFTFSPDGSHIVYDTLNGASENLWIMNADGSGRRKLTSDSYRNRSPQWSPKGGQIAFYSDRGGTYEVWTIRQDGSGLRQLTSHSDPQMQNGVWSPDGRQYLSSRFGVAVMVDAVSSGASMSEAPGLHGTPGTFCNHWTPGPEGSLAVCDLLIGPTAPEVVIYSPAVGKLEHTGVTGSESFWAPSPRNREPHRAFFVHRGAKCFLYDRILRRETQLFSVAPSEIYNMMIDPDGRYLYFSERSRQSKLWLAHLRNSDR